MLSRRNLLAGILSAAAAPIFIPSNRIMRVAPVVVPDWSAFIPYPGGHGDSHWNAIGKIVPMGHLRPMRDLGFTGLTWTFVREVP